jgi:hypothetical protein
VPFSPTEEGNAENDGIELIVVAARKGRKRAPFKHPFERYWAG